MVCQPDILPSKEIFRSYDLTYTGKLQSYRIEDLDNDGLKDLLLVQQQEISDGRGRLIALYIQNENGFSATPSQEFKLPDKVAVFDIGNVSGDARKELVFLVPGSIWYYALTDSGFDLSPILLLKSESLFILQDGRSDAVFDFVRNLNGSGLDELIVPTITETNIFYSNKQLQWVNHRLPLQAEVQYTGSFSRRFSVGSRTSAVYSTPYITWQDFDNDDKADLVAVYRDSLVVFCQNEAGIFADSSRFQVPLDYGKIWKGGKIQRTRMGDDRVRRFLMRVIDLNNDGRLDIVASRVSTEESVMNPTTQLMIHFGRPDSSKSENGLRFNPIPDQILRPNGTRLVLDIFDLNHDGRYDLLVPVVRVGLANVMRMLLTKSMEIKIAGYFMDEKDRYPVKPDFETRLRMKFSYRGGATSPVYEIADFDGDGYLDMMGSERNRLVLFQGQGNGSFSSSATKRQEIFLPQDGELVTALQINDDAKADLVIEYGKATTRPDLYNLLRILLSN